jgi:hypothetical protein
LASDLSGYRSGFGARDVKSGENALGDLSQFARSTGGNSGKSGAKPTKTNWILADQRTYWPD